ncbi:FAD-dependent oxidoreductase [Clostridium sp. AM58-1XD]|uniref:FAD-dependent oxidoreductase n=1 Tax=Clostridium sp. AM58-1XD TaxID=2292307 RepID=UPI000E48BAC9|nr:FAD-dependent oxidoreductase [Clostridium sp. AM58-1XD]RGZ00693.1 FAD-dependent oxidoreductase [Clostridium sp. AM58-1XD]
MEFVIRGEQKIAAREYDVVVCGGGTGGVIAAVAAARGGARTAVIESKGYVGGIAAEGGCGLHSSYNLWKAFPGVEKRQVVRGIPEEFIQRLTQAGGASGHNETIMRFDYDSDTLCVDVEIYKYIALQMLREEGVDVLLNTMAVDVVMDGENVNCVITESHQGCEAVKAKVFIDATGYGDLCARAGASYTEPNDYMVANSMGIAGINIDKYYSFLKDNGALIEYGRGPRSGRTNQIIRVDGDWSIISPELDQQVKGLGMHTVTTTLHDDYLMFIKLNFQMPASPTNRDALAEAEYELRDRQQKALKLLKNTIPGASDAFISRSGPCIAIRRARCISCEYDLSNEEIINATHFDDDVFSYGFHDWAPMFQIKGGKTYGFPYRAMVVKGLANLFATGMMVTSDKNAHMSTRNTISCMAQGQAAGTAAALCVQKEIKNIRDLKYGILHDALKQGNVWFDAEVSYRQ